MLAMEPVPKTIRSRSESLTVVILTKNEAANLPRCLDAVPDRYPVVVLDSGSTDNTTEVASRRGCIVFRQPWLGFAGQRNYALQHCGIANPWVLFVDTDEVYPQGFFDWFEMEARNRHDVDIFMVPSYLYLRGRQLRHAPGYPVYHPRLVYRERASFVTNYAGHGESVQQSCRILYASIAYSHYFYNGDLVGWMHKHIDHASLESHLQSEQGVVLTRRGRFNMLLGNSVLRIPLRFFYHYVLRGGFLDGREGLEYTKMYTWYEASKYLLNSSKDKE